MATATLARLFTWSDVDALCRKSFALCAYRREGSASRGVDAGPDGRLQVLRACRREEQGHPDCAHEGEVVWGLLDEPVDDPLDDGVLLMCEFRERVLPRPGRQRRVLRGHVVEAARRVVPAVEHGRHALPCRLQHRVVARYAVVESQVEQVGRGLVPLVDRSVLPLPVGRRLHCDGVVPPPVHAPQLAQADFQHPVEDALGRVDAAVVSKQPAGDGQRARKLRPVYAALGPEGLLRPKQARVVDPGQDVLDDGPRGVEAAPVYALDHGGGSVFAGCRACQRGIVWACSPVMREAEHG